jgi:hypothetical protein
MQQDLFRQLALHQPTQQTQQIFWKRKGTQKNPIPFLILKYTHKWDTSTSKLKNTVL